MKKFISVLLALMISFSAFFVTASCVEAEKLPIIVVPGYSASCLYAVDDDGAERMIWGSFEGLNIVDVVLANIAQIGLGLGGLAFGQPDYLAEIVGNGIVEILGELACEPDGTPVVETVTYPNDPAKTNYAYLINEMGSMHAAETEIMADIAEAYGENGYENIFSFQTDFRLSIVDAIENLRGYIDAVLEYTGADKVNIFAVSYGGQITASYLNVYGFEKKVHNAVLTVPAIGGAALAYDVMNENVRLDEETLFYFIENGMMLEEDINWLMKAHALGGLDELLNKLIKNGIKDLIQYWGSIWDFIPAEYYEEMKQRFLDPIENAELIGKSDKFHYEILPTMSVNLQNCISNETNVYIIAGCDSPAVTGLYEQSDGIILVSGATNANCAPFGLRFADGFTGLGTVCDNPEHNHISPAMNIDASTCFLPEQTWFISGLFHGMTWKDEYTKKLCKELLFAENALSVHSSPEFPQYKYSTNPCHSVGFSFDNSPDGFLSSKDSSLRVENLSKKYRMKIVSVEVYGADIKFNIPCNSVLDYGETAEFEYEGILPEISYSTVDVIVNYVLIGDIIFQGSRLQTFGLNNGSVPDYNVDTPYTEGVYDTEFEVYTPGFIKTLFIKVGIYDLIKMLFNTLFSLFCI